MLAVLEKRHMYYSEPHPGLVWVHFTVKPIQWEMYFDNRVEDVPESTQLGRGMRSKSPPSFSVYNVKLKGLYFLSEKNQPQ